MNPPSTEILGPVPTSSPPPTVSTTLPTTTTGPTVTSRLPRNKAIGFPNGLTICLYEQNKNLIQRRCQPLR